MDNNQFPEQEETGFFPEETAEEPVFEPADPPIEETPLDHSILEHPERGQEITADEHAMAFHGMLHPNEPEPPFDMSVLEDPELDVPAVQEQPQEPPMDQQYRDSGEDFNAIFSAPAEEEPIPTHDRPTRKGRPKRRKGELLFGIPQLAVTAVWLAIILVTGVTLGRMLWVCAADVLAFGREDRAVEITIEDSDTLKDISKTLAQQGLIEFPGLFRLYAKFSGKAESFFPGTYELNAKYDYPALAKVLSSGTVRREAPLPSP